MAPGLRPGPSKQNHFSAELQTSTLEREREGKRAALPAGVWKGKWLRRRGHPRNRSSLSRPHLMWKLVFKCVMLNSPSMLLKALLSGRRRRRGTRGGNSVTASHHFHYGHTFLFVLGVGPRASHTWGNALPLSYLQHIHHFNSTTGR